MASTAKEKLYVLTGSDELPLERQCEKTRLDDDDHLKDWGFDDKTCHNCGKVNSDLDGLLMQCAKCKKAYYCSSKCFNEHLPIHSAQCSTGGLIRDPKVSEIKLEPSPKAKKGTVGADGLKKNKKLKSPRKNTKSISKIPATTLDKTEAPLSPSTTKKKKKKSGEKSPKKSPSKKGKKSPTKKKKSKNTPEEASVPPVIPAMPSLDDETEGKNLTRSDDEETIEEILIEYIDDVKSNDGLPIVEKPENDDDDDSTIIEYVYEYRSDTTKPPVPSEIIVDPDTKEKDEENEKGDRLLVLYTSKTPNKQDVVDQEKIFDILDSTDVKYGVLDKKDPASETRRDELLAISGQTHFPQVFKVAEDGETTFWGGADQVADAAEEGDLRRDLRRRQSIRRPNTIPCFPRPEKNHQDSGPRKPKRSSSQERDQDTSPTKPRSDSDRDSLLVLYTSSTPDKETVIDQKKTVRMLDDIQAEYGTLDAQDPSAQEVCKELQEISGCNDFPQMFEVTKDGAVQYWGGVEKLNQLHRRASIRRKTPGDSDEGDEKPKSRINNDDVTEYLFDYEEEVEESRRLRRGGGNMNIGDNSAMNSRLNVGSGVIPEEEPYVAETVHLRAVDQEQREVESTDPNWATSGRISGEATMGDKDDTNAASDSTRLPAGEAAAVVDTEGSAVPIVDGESATEDFDCNETRRNMVCMRGRKSSSSPRHGESVPDRDSKGLENATAADESATEGFEGLDCNETSRNMVCMLGGKQDNLSGNESSVLAAHPKNLENGSGDASEEGSTHTPIYGESQAECFDCNETERNMVCMRGGRPSNNSSRRICGVGSIPDMDPKELEKIRLREVETQKKEIGWHQPDWALASGSNHEPSEHADSPVTKRGSVVLRAAETVKRDVVRKEPDWVHLSPSRKTTKGKISVDILASGLGGLNADGSPARRGQTYCSPRKGTITRLSVGLEDIPASPEFDPENLDLRNAAIQKLDVSWEMPDWTRQSPLRKTSKGERIAARGNLSRRLSELKSYVSHKPDWVINSPLRRKKTVAAQAAKGTASPMQLPAAVPFD